MMRRASDVRIKLICFGVALLFFGAATITISQNASISLNQFFKSTSNFKQDDSISFSAISKINLDINDVPLTIVESDVKEVTVTSTAKNSGIGFATQAKAWEDNGTLYYTQGFVFGIEPKSTGYVTIEIPYDLELDYDINSGSGDVLIDIESANNIFINAAVGTKNVSSYCDNLDVHSVSGDINIYKASQNINIETVSSDATLSANEVSRQINFESISADLNVCANYLSGYNIHHDYSGGKIDEYIKLSDNGDNTININAKTVDGDITVYEKSEINELSVFFEEE